MQQQTFTGPYDYGSLRLLNDPYTVRRAINGEDVERVNRFLSSVETSRTNEMPLPGDIVRFTDRDGNFYPDSFIEDIEDGKPVICHRPGIPLVYSSGGVLKFHSCGGQASITVPVGDLRYSGAVRSRFKVRGHRPISPASSPETVEFDAVTSLWEYGEPDLKYGHFTTRTWRKMVLERSDHPSADGYLYKCGIHIFRDEQELQEFMNSFCGTIFPEPDGKTYVLWCYRDESVSVSSDQWDAIGGGAVSRNINGVTISVKTVKDLEKHIVYSYYKDNGYEKVL